MGLGVGSLNTSTNLLVESLDLSGTRTASDDTPKTLSTGHTRTDSALGGSSVTLRTGSSSQSADTQRAESFSRLKQPSLSGGGRAMAALTLVALGPTLLIAKGIAMLGAKVLTMVMGQRTDQAGEAAQARADLRATLGRHDTTDAGQILNMTITIKDAGAAGGTATKTIMDLMESYVDKLNDNGSRTTKDDMKMYVCMGEKIYASLYEGDSAEPPLQIDVGGTMKSVPSNLDTTRALSWFLQARGMADNASTTRTFDDLTLVSSGAMIAKDPGNRLYDFMSSAPQCYGRCSSHCAERSSNSGGGWLEGLQAIWKGGALEAAVRMGTGQPIQHGIEDYDNRFPSKGGTLLFDKLHDSDRDGVGEIYLKWEEVGTPTAFGFITKHMDDADGFAARVTGNYGALGRVKEHMSHFTENADPAGYHGEKMEKGPAKKVFTQFEEAVRGLDTSVLSSKEGATVIKEVKTFGAVRMEHRLGELIDRAETGRADAAHVQALKEARTAIQAFIAQAGADLGIVRKGQELHVGMPPKTAVSK